MSASSPFDKSLFERVVGFSPNRLKRAFILGVKSLWLHRLRSMLTVLGIVFGVCSVIAMLAIGEGLSYEVREQIRQLGSSNIIIRSVKPPESQSTSNERRRMLEYGLTYTDMDRIRGILPGVDQVIPARIIRRNVWAAAQRADCDIKGTLPSYPEVTNKVILPGGRFFSKLENEANENVCVLEEALARALFPLDSAIGRNVRVDAQYYTVIGVMAASGEVPSPGKGPQLEGATPQGAPHAMYIPLKAARNRFGETLVRMSTGSFQAEKVELHEAVVRMKNEDDVIDAARVIGAILKMGHKQNDYTMIVPIELLRQAEETKRLFNIVLGSVAAISLVVGGIGIMNIMLATVTERTREIGIRRALGAKRRDIVFQFLIETVLLSGLGGLIGVGLGLAIPLLISRFADMETIVTFWAPLIAFSISALVGVVFGIYPAMRAADMDPVEALRHE